MVYSTEFCKGSCVRNSVYLQMSSVLDDLKKIVLKILAPPEFKIMRNFVTPKSVKFRGIRRIP